MPLRFDVVGKTDVGLVRPGNEDCLHLDEQNVVFAVCDGMGGHQAGEVASQAASQVLLMVYDRFQAEIFEAPLLKIDRDLPFKGDILVKAIRLANRSIFDKAVQDPSLAGMGTTIAAVALEEDVMSVAHVGDSRVYRIDEKRLHPLTRDHSWVAEIQHNQSLTEDEAASIIGKNVITRALGVRENVEIDYRAVRVKTGDKFLLCSDGLCGYADDDEIFQVVYKFRGDNQRLADNLIRLANDRGGADNVSVIVLEILEVNPSSLAETDVFTLPGELPEVLKAEDEWLTKLEAPAAQETEPPPKSTGRRPGGSRFFLLLIFAAFAALALYIIYSSTSR